MDLSTMIVDMLRGGKEEEILNMGGPLAKPSPRPSPELQAAGQHLRNPLYTAYKREALANGEPVMSPDEFEQIQGKGSY